MAGPFAVNTIQGERNWRQAVSNFIANTLTSSSQTGGIPVTTLTASLGADVTLNNTATYFDGPSVAQGTSGTWYASGTVTCVDTAGAAQFRARLWDGTTVVASSVFSSAGLGSLASISLSGFFTNPAGNIRISVKDVTSVSGAIKFNQSGDSKDSTVTAVRVG